MVAAAASGAAGGGGVAAEAAAEAEAEAAYARVVASAAAVDDAEREAVAAEREVPKACPHCGTLVTAGRGEPEAGACWRLAEALTGMPRR